MPIESYSVMKSVIDSVAPAVIVLVLLRSIGTVSSILQLALITQEIRKFHLTVYRQVSKRSGSSPKISLEAAAVDFSDK